jgi:hypothetical protein
LAKISDTKTIFFQVGTKATPNGLGMLPELTEIDSGAGPGHRSRTAWRWFPHARFFFFFLKKDSKIFSQCKSFTKEKVFLCLCTLFVFSLNHEPFVKEVGTVLRTEGEIFSRVTFERMSGQRKKKLFCQTKTQKILPQKDWCPYLS